MKQDTKTTISEEDGTIKTVHTQTCTKFFKGAMVPGERTELHLDAAGKVYRSLRSNYLAPGPKWLIKKPAWQQLFASDEQGTRAILGQEVTYHDTHCKPRTTARLIDGKYVAHNRYTYDDSGRVVAVIDAQGRSTELGYGAGHLPTALNKHPAPGQSLITRYEYDYSLGGVMTAVTDENEQSTRMRYDGLARLKSVTPAGSSTPSMSFDYFWGDATKPTQLLTRRAGISKPTISYFDSLFRPAASIEPSAQNAYALSDFKVYDLAGRVIVEAEAPLAVPVDPSQWSLPLTHMRRRSFDHQGRVVKESLPLADDAEGRYSVAGASIPKGTEYHLYSAYLTHSYDAEGNHSAQEFDQFGRTIRSTIGEAGSSTTTSVTAAYDAVDRLTQLQVADLPARRYRYDESSRLREFMSPELGTMQWDYTPTDKVEAQRLLANDGSAVASRYFSYDDTDRELESRILDVKNLNFKTGFNEARRHYRYVYDKAQLSPDQQTFVKGRVAGLELFAGAALGYGYDARGNQIYAETKLYGKSFVIRNAFDISDRLTKVTYPDGKQISYAYDPQSGLLASALPLINQVDYTDTRLLRELSFSSGLRQSYTYDPVTGVIATHAVASGSGAEVAEYKYGPYDALKRLKDFSGEDLSASSISKSFSYDARAQLSHAELSFLPKSGSPKVSLSEDYAYSAAGFPLSIGGQAVRYQHSAKGALEKIAFGQEEAVFGRFGNLSGTKAIQKLGWYGSGKLACTVQSGARSRFSYLPDGNRFTEVKERGGARRSTVFIGKYAEYEKESGKFTNHYFLDKQRLGTERDGKVEIDVSDHLGSPGLTVSPSGELVSYRQRGPWGETLLEKSAEAKRYSFTGALFDQESGLHQMQTRYYAAGFRGFVSADEYFMQNPEKVLGSPLEGSLYNYGRNNPLK